MTEIGEPIKTTVEEIRKFLNVENVVGKTIETDEYLMIPFIRWVWDSLLEKEMDPWITIR